VRELELLARVGAAVLTPQPLAIHEVGTGKVGPVELTLGAMPDVDVWIVPVNGNGARSQ
jgi:hypothetical protein